MTLLTPDPDFGPRAVVDSSGFTHDTPEEAFFAGALGLCGCGLSSYVASDMVAWLRYAKERSEPGGRDARGNSVMANPIDHDVYADLIAHVLAQAMLIEHGGSAAGGWPTPLGLRWLRAMDVVPPAEGDENDE